MKNIYTVHIYMVDTKLELKRLNILLTTEIFKNGFDLWKFFDAYFLFVRLVKYHLCRPSLILLCDTRP